MTELIYATLFVSGRLRANTPLEKAPVSYLMAEAAEVFGIAGEGTITRIDRGEIHGVLFNGQNFLILVDEPREPQLNFGARHATQEITV